jgi:hypothetical protein
MPKKSNNSKNFKMWPKQSKKKAPKDILSEADDIISRLILKTECDVECKMSNTKVFITSVMCLTFAVFVAYVIIKY